jgi:hypothetical protein
VFSGVGPVRPSRLLATFSGIMADHPPRRRCPLLLENCGPLPETSHQAPPAGALNYGHMCENFGHSVTLSWHIPDGLGRGSLGLGFPWAARECRLHIGQRPRITCSWVAWSLPGAHRAVAAGYAAAGYAVADAVAVVPDAIPGSLGSARAGPAGHG